MIRPSRALLPAAAVLLACTAAPPATADDAGAPGSAIVRPVSGVSPLPADCGPPPPTATP
ncbi:hypothetical protein ACFQ0B_20945 [Nonomuraea thailandensis]